MMFPFVHGIYGAAAAPVEEASQSAQIISNAVNNATNVREYRVSSIASNGSYQICTYWKTSAQLVIGVRALPSALTAWTFYLYDGSPLTAIVNPGATDHHVASIGIDKDGFLHVSYGMANEALNYRKSTLSVSTFAGVLGDEITMLGTNETSVTYPEFINDGAGNLYFMFRAGLATGGDIYLYKYNETTEAWAAAPGTGTAGLLIENDATEDTAYFYTPAVDKTGALHFGWHWRENGVDGNTNHDLGYVRYNGTSFFQADGSAQTAPINISNQDTAVAITAGNGLGGHGRQVAADKLNRPHLVYVANDGSSDAQVWHVYWNGSAWTTPQALTVQTTVTSTGDPPPGEINGWTAPIIAINQDTGAAHVAYTGLTKTGIYLLKSTNYTDWVETQIWTPDTRFYAIQFDPQRWKAADILSILITKYPAGGNLGHLLEYTPAQP